MNGLMMVSHALTASGMTFGERVSDSLIMLVKGMVMVFAVLAILMIVLMIMEKIFARVNNKKASAPAPAKVAEVAPDNAGNEDDGALVAAITAAVAVVLSEEAAPAMTGFRVVSFKRVSEKSAWNAK